MSKIIITIIRYIFLVCFLVMAYKETGFYTVAILFLIFLYIELQNLLYDQVVKNQKDLIKKTKEILELFELRKNKNVSKKNVD